MECICTLKPNVTREEALRLFQPRSLAGAIRYVRRGSLRSIAEMYIPFRLYRVVILNGAKREEKLFGLDAVRGMFDLYVFDSVPGPDSLQSIHTRNHPPPTLPLERGGEIVIEKVRRMIYQTGFFRVRNLTLHVEMAPLDFHVPYWVGFFGSLNDLDCLVMDAVRRSIEGEKIKSFVDEWLKRPEREGENPRRQAMPMKFQ